MGIVKRKLWICGLLCMLCLTGCAEKELLQEKLDVSQIDKIVVTTAMGNPANGADCKVITDGKEIEDLVFLFNNAYVEERISEKDEWVAGSASFAFFRGDEQVLKLNCNANDAERIWINDAFYEIDYPDDMADPNKLYKTSSAKVIRVDENGKEI